MKKQIAIAAAIAASFALWAAVSPQTAVDKETPALTPTPAVDVYKRQVDQLLDVSQATANRILKQMVAEGLIYQDGNGRKTKYRRK